MRAFNFEPGHLDTWTPGHLANSFRTTGLETGLSDTLYTQSKAADGYSQKEVIVDADGQTHFLCSIKRRSPRVAPWRRLLVCGAEC